MQIESVFAQFGIAIILATASSVGSAQDRNWASFPELIKMPGGIQAALEHCDGHPDFEAALANWLEAARPESAAERRVVREASLQLLEDTADRQVALALIDGLLRHALADVNRDETIVPERLARSIYAEIVEASKNRQFKVRAIAMPAYGLAEEDVTDERQASFTEQFLNLADPRVQHHVQVARPARAARPSPPVSIQPKPQPDEPVALPVVGKAPQVLLIFSVIWLLLHLFRGRRTA